MKKFKKLLVALFAFAAIGASMTACGKDEEEFVVGIIYIGSKTDGGYSQSHAEGIQFMVDQLKEDGKNVKVLEVEDVPEDETAKTKMEELIDKGAKVIFANSYGFMDYVTAVAKEHPEVTFMHCSGYMNADNYNNYFGRIYQARYISGVIAGYKLKELYPDNKVGNAGKIGYVAAFDIPEVIRGMDAFTLGVLSVQSNAQIETKYTMTWYDPAVEKNTAIALLDRGADIIAQHQDTPEPQKAAEERGKFSIGYNMPMHEAAPKATLASAVWHWGPFYYNQVKSVIDGTWTSESYWEGYTEDVVRCAINDALVTDPDVLAKVEEIEESFKNETFDVFTGTIIDNQGQSHSNLTDSDLLSMEWYVKGITELGN